MITNGFPKLSDAELFTRASQIQAAMTGNVNFPKPDPTVAVMATIVKDFSDALKACRDRDRVKIAVKNQKREALINALHKWSAYVTFESKGNIAIALTSGFSVRKSPVPSPPLEKPTHYRVENGKNPGELISFVSRVAFAVSYLHQYADDEMLEADNWQSVPSSRITCVISNLKAGTRYHCRVAVLGTRGQVMYSDIAMRIVA